MKLSLINEYTSVGNEITSTNAKETNYNQLGGQVLLDMEAKIAKKISIFISPRYNIIPKKVAETFELYNSDDFSFCIGIRLINVIQVLNKR